jgi:hypothetical protein
LIARAAHLAAAAVVLTAAVYAPPARAQAAAGAIHLLDVPYLPQTEALCGGAALAMVMRYWGAGSVYAETFADLVDPAAGGIRGDDLLQALHSRGWQATSRRGDPSLVQSSLAVRRPVIVLIEDRPGRFHYVVVVGWAGGRVIVHDPARAPFRVVDESAFSQAWMQSGYWTLLAAPPAAAAAAGTAPPGVSPGRESGPVAPSIPSPCTAMVSEGVRLAETTDRDGARRLFEVAAETCPDSPAPWREMAGLHALRGEWAEAAADARRALSKVPADPLASQILATALYLQGDADGALAAWNDAGEPIIDLVNIVGLQRTRYGVVARALGLEPRTLLTPAALRAARRRLSELPAGQMSRLGYKPGENGRAQVEAAVLERPLLPTAPVSLAAIGARALTDRELRLGVASPTGGGEMWTAAWRWWERRPRVAVGFEAPAPFGGVWGVGADAERQAYADAGSTVVEARRRAVFHASNWTLGGLRWEAEAGVDRWRGERASATLAASAQQRFAGDRAYLEARAGGWRGGVNTWTFGARSEWRSSPRNEGVVWIARAGIDAAGERAPLALWPGAGTGHGRDTLLRAHPLLDEGVFRGGVFGRQVAHAGGEWRRWWQPKGRPLQIAPAIFVDTARASAGLAGFDARSHIDAGAGLRIAVPGAGALRIDLARGLRDGSMALSAGWTR